VETFLEALPLLGFLRFPPWFPYRFPVETFEAWKLAWKLHGQAPTADRTGVFRAEWYANTVPFRISRWFSFLICVLFRAARIDGALLGTHLVFCVPAYHFAYRFAYRAISHRGG
jgi:hypothetical protein